MSLEYLVVSESKCSKVSENMSKGLRSQLEGGPPLDKFGNFNFKITDSDGYNPLNKMRIHETLKIEINIYK